MVDGHWVVESTEKIAEAYEIFEQKRDGVIKVAVIN